MFTTLGNPAHRARHQGLRRGPRRESFWDALIRSAAAENGVAIVYSEDFQEGRDVEGVRFVNPFGALPKPTG